MPLQQEEIQQNVNRTINIREFKGVNLTNTRTSIEDGEFSWLENAIPIGSGNVTLVPGITTPALTGDTLPTTVSRLFGFVLGGNPILMAVGSNGALSQIRLDTLVVTTVAPASTVTTAVRMVMWRSERVLIVDPTTGYFSWDGTLFQGEQGNASVTIAPAGANNDLVYTARLPGTGGNAIRIEYVVAGNNTPLTVNVVGNDITVNVATDGVGAPTSTAAQVAAAINASGPARNLVLAPQNAAGNDGTGVVAAVSFTNLTGGAIVPYSAIEVFAGRTWLVTPNSRTFTFTAPDSFDNFAPAAGSGAATITDSVFVGNITNLITALEQLWIVGPAAVNALTNVSTTGSPLTTTFSLTNIVSSVGSTLPASVSTFFRTVLFLTPYGVYAIVGATPQKLSDKLDGLFPLLSFASSDAPAATTSVHNVFVWCVLVTYTAPPAAGRPLLLCFAQGKWFFAATPGLAWITSVSVNGTPQLWGSTGGTVVRLFASAAATVAYDLQTKLWDFGDATQKKMVNRWGLELVSSQPISTTVTHQTEQGDRRQYLNVGRNELVFIGAGGTPITFSGTAPIVWLISGLNAAFHESGVIGNYHALRLQGTEAVWTLANLALEVRPGGKWQKVA